MTISDRRVRRDLRNLERRAQRASVIYQKSLDRQALARRILRAVAVELRFIASTKKVGVFVADLPQRTAMREVAEGLDVALSHDDVRELFNTIEGAV